MNNEEKQIREICTTLKEHGGGYYNLSEEQFQKIFEVVAQAVQQAKREMRANIILLNQDERLSHPYDASLEDYKEKVLKLFESYPSKYEQVERK